MARGWIDLLRSVGDSLLEVVNAEVSALKEDLTESGRRFSVVLALGAAAAFLLFWALGAAVFALFQVLNLWLDAWVAALIVLGLLLILALVLALLARNRWRSIEVPADTVRRRLDDHVAWWHQEVLEAGDRKSPAELETGDLNDR